MKFDLVLLKLWAILLVQEIREPNHDDHVIGRLGRAKSPLKLLLAAHYAKINSIKIIPVNSMR